MFLIHLITNINAPIERVFDLSLSIELHLKSMAKTGEQVLTPRTTGLLGEGEVVTWRGRHFGLMQELTTIVEHLRRPYHFHTRMLKGAFQTLEHDHIYEPTPTGCRMIDKMQFTVPLGILGWPVGRFLIQPYMKRILEERNAFIKSLAEGEEWQQYLS